MGTYSPNNPHSAAGRDGVRNDKIRVRHIRQEARAERGPIIVSHVLQTHRTCGSVRLGVRHSRLCRYVRESRHSHVGERKACGTRRFCPGPGRYRCSRQQSTPLVLQCSFTINVVPVSSSKALYNYMV